MSYGNKEPQNGIILFFNEDSETNEKAPEFKGKVKMADGTEFEVALWRRVSEKTGNEFWSGNMKLPQVKPQSRGRPTGDEPQQGRRSFNSRPAKASEDF